MYIKRVVVVWDLTPIGFCSKVANGCISAMVLMKIPIGGSVHLFVKICLLNMWLGRR